MHLQRRFHLAAPFLGILPFLLAAVRAEAVSIDRGPYVQSNTTNSAIVVWRFSSTSSALLEYGPTLTYGNQIPSDAATTHALTVTGLQPGRRYYYRILADGQELSGGEDDYIETAPVSGGLKAILFGDSGKGNRDQAEMAVQISSEVADLILHMGDIAYSVGAESRYDGRFFQPYADILRHTPIFPVLGNHDTYTDNGGPWLNNFYLPVGSFDGTERNYSFDWGDAHFVAINSNQISNALADWVAADLAASSKTWKFAYLHHATYSCGYHGSNYAVKTKLVPVFEAQGVDVVFAGHEHDYQRTFPILNGGAVDVGEDPDYVNPPGPIYVITGGGANPRDTSSSCWFTNVALSVTHATRLQIAGELLVIEAVDRNGVRVDRMSLRKTATPSSAYVQILNGNGREHWRIGSTVPITWQTGGLGGTVAIELSRDGGSSWETLAATTDDDGAFDWTVSGPGSSRCLLRIRDARTEAGTADVSAATFWIELQPSVDPSVSVQASPTSGEAPLDVSFSATMSVSEVSLLFSAWDFGDGQTGSGTSAQHTYASAGTYTASFSATTSDSVEIDDAATITVLPGAPPDLTLSASVTSGYAPLTVEFTAGVSDQSAIASQIWRFGDGDSATAAGATHTYSLPGTHAATFEARDTHGYTSTDTILVGILDPASDTTAPLLVSRSPAPGAADASTKNPILVTLRDPETGVDSSSVTLRVGGDVVQPEITVNGDSLVVLYRTPTPFGLDSTVDVSISASDRASSPNAASWSWSFVATVASPTVDVSINFQPRVSATPAGYVADPGDPHDTRLGYGWNKPVPTRERATNPDQRLDTYAYVDNGSAATWTLEVPNGGYVVTLCVGSPRYTGLHRVVLEGELVVDDVYTRGGQFHTVTEHAVTVSDGYVSVQIGGISGSSKKTKICYVEVQSTGSSQGDPPPNQAPVGSASAAPDSGDAPLTVVFTASASDADGDSLAHAWSFGDGQTAATGSVQHTYTDPGTYEAVLTVRDPDGATAADTVSIVVQAAGTDEPGSDESGSDVTFAKRISFQPATSSVPAGYEVDTGAAYDASRGYGWNRNVPTKERFSEPDQRLDTYAYVDNGSSAVWELAVADGTYLVTLVAGSPRWTALHRVVLEGELVVDDVLTGRGQFVTVDGHATSVSDGFLTIAVGNIQGSSKKTKLCYVDVLGSASASGDPAANRAPVASASASPDSGEAALTVEFSATASDADGDSLAYSWSFGDGDSAAADSIQHTFIDPGTYDVVLSVCDPDAACARDTVSVSVVEPAPEQPPPNQAPVATASATPDSGAAPLVVQFAGAASDADGDSLAYAWSFGDGDSAAADSVQHTFGEAGIYVVVLRVSDPQGGTATDSLSVQVTDAPPDSSGAGSSASWTLVNFQPPGSSVPEGYVADTGSLFDASAGFGWNRDVRTKIRGSNPDPRLDTYAYVSNASQATWELAVDAGTYLVTLVAGSPRWTALHRVEVEGLVVIDNVATTSREFVTASEVPVTVVDGRLTLRIGGIPGGAKKTKLCYLEVRPAPPGKSDPGANPAETTLRLHPNPANPATTVEMRLGSAMFVRVDIFDVRGRSVRRLYRGLAPPGTLLIRWDGRDDAGARVTSGVYFVRASLHDRRYVLKLALVQ